MSYEIWKQQFKNALYFPKANQYTAVGNPFRSIGIFGGAGSGKTESLFKPTIAQAVKQGAGIVLYDYKSPELGQFLKDCVEGNKLTGGRSLPVYHVDFNDPYISAKINPLAPKYIKDPLAAKELAKALYYNLNPKALSSSGDPFWDNNAISILQATIWYLKVHEPERCDIPSVVNLVLSPLGDLLDALRQDSTCSKLLAPVLSAYDQQSSNLLASIAATVQSPLSQLIGDDITYIMETSNEETPLDINNPDNPCILIIGTNQQVPEAYSPLISLILTVALRQMNQADMHPSYVILDEAPTIYIPGIENYPAVTRSRKIAFVYGAQDISQIDKAYGKDRRNALLSNLANQFFGRTPSNETIKYICDLFGKEDREYVSQSHSSSTSSGDKSSSRTSGSSTSVSVQQRAVLQAQDILGFKPGQFAFLNADPMPHDTPLSIVQLLSFGQSPVPYVAPKVRHKRTMPKALKWGIIILVVWVLMAIGRYLMIRQQTNSVFDSIEELDPEVRKEYDKIKKELDEIK